MSEYGEIYVITNQANGKKYVGQTTCGIKARWRKHLRQAAVGRLWPLACAIRKYGSENFTIEKLDCSPITSQEELNAAEVAAIARLGTTRRDCGYNATLGGECGTLTSDALARLHVVMLRPEVKERRRAAMKAAWARPGYKSRLHISMKEVVWSNPEWLANVSAASRAAWARPGMKERRSALAKKMRTRPEVKERHREANNRPEVRERRRAANKEAQNRPEVKERNSTAQKAAWALIKHARAMRMLPWPAAVLRVHLRA